MSVEKEIVKFRKATGMNRREFCEYFGIPYRTVQDWEAGKRSMPDYLFRLMKYKAEIEKIMENDKEQSDMKQLSKNPPRDCPYD